MNVITAGEHRRGDLGDSNYSSLCAPKGKTGLEGRQPESR